MPKPICVNCESEYVSEKNNVIAEELAGFGSYQLWFADLWKCPKCGHLLITGFGAHPWAEHWQNDYKAKLEVATPRYKF